MTARERALVARAGALLILLALAAAVWLGPVAAYRDLLDSDVRQIEAQEQTLARYRALVRQPETAAAIDDKAVLFPENSDAQAVALLQVSLKAAATAAAVEIQGLQVLQAESLAGASRVGVRLKGRGDIAGLDRLLYAIETSRPLLYPDNLRIDARGGQAGAPMGPLDFQLDVSGFKTGPAT